MQIISCRHSNLDFNFKLSDTNKDALATSLRAKCLHRGIYKLNLKQPSTCM